jgi:hypothetical protein
MPKNGTVEANPTMHQDDALKRKQRPPASMNWRESHLVEDEGIAILPIASEDKAVIRNKGAS